MLTLSLTEFAQKLSSDGGRLALWNEGGRLIASDPKWQPFAEMLQSLPDFQEHLAAFISVGPRTGQLHSVFLHRTARGPGAGGVRRRIYPDVAAWLTDGLRLAIGMGCKNALAGLWWGGGKGVIGCLTLEHDRVAVYEEFGDFMSELSGCYVTAEDVGTKPEDMATIFTRTRFTTCIPAAFGGSGNPSPATARGVFVGIEAALKHLGKPLAGAKVALQGLGEVGSRVAELLDEAGVDMFVYDPDDARMEAALALSDRHRAATADSVLTEDVDVLSPCALGAILNPQTIPNLRCRAICGAANNQLELEPRDAESLHNRGILYIPDFLVNRMGIVNCADEQYGRLEPDPAIERHLGWEWEQAIGPLTLELLKRSAQTGKPPLIEAAARADELMKEPHPLWPGRSKQIVRAVWERFSAHSGAS